MSATEHSPFEKTVMPVADTEPQADPWHTKEDTKATVC